MRQKYLATGKMGAMSASEVTSEMAPGQIEASNETQPPEVLRNFAVPMPCPQQPATIVHDYIREERAQVSNTITVTRPAEDELSKKRFAMVLKESDGESDALSIEHVSPRSTSTKKQYDHQIIKNHRSKMGKREDTNSESVDEMDQIQAEIDRKNQFSKKREVRPTTVEGYQAACLQIDKERQELMAEEQMLQLVNNERPEVSGTITQKKTGVRSNSSKKPKQTMAGSSSVATK